MALHLPLAGCKVESIFLNVVAVNTHRDRPQVPVGSLLGWQQLLGGVQAHPGPGGAGLTSPAGCCPDCRGRPRPGGGAALGVGKPLGQATKLGHPLSWGLAGSPAAPSRGLSQGGHPAGEEAGGLQAAGEGSSVLPSSPAS